MSSLKEELSRYDTPDTVWRLHYYINVAEREKVKCLQKLAEIEAKLELLYRDRGDTIA
jgi:hypothetical protein